VTDLLDLHEEPARPRPPRRLPKPVGLLVVGLVLLAIVAAIVLGGKALVGSFRSNPDYDGAGRGDVVVQIREGDSARDIAATLLEKGVVKSIGAFTEAAAEEPKSRSLQPGYYSLRQMMSAEAALDLLLDPSARLRGRVTIPEGTSVEGALELIAKNTELKIADLKAAAANPAVLGLPAYAKNRLEGFLFPATYDVEPGTTAVEALQTMVQRYDEEAETLDLVAGAQALGLTPYEVVVVASLIERESRVDEELPKVARVIYNRLDKRIKLGIDASVLYGLGRRSGGLTQSDLRKDTPYNTRVRLGLPPTPIANPGTAALQAALDPAEGDILYYVLADKEGNHLFTASYDEFLRQKAKSQREGVF
jgi:UPF0755 protein